MDTKRFYGKAKTISEAISKASTSNSSATIIILPPAAGESAVDSDVESISEDLFDENQLFETAGEAKIEVEGVEISDSEDEVELPPQKKRAKNKKSQPKWKKQTTFKKSLPEDVMTPVVDTHQDLILLSPYELWSRYFSEDMVQNLVEQSTLYARRDKNSPNFSVDSGEMRRFLGILLLSGYHSLPQEAHYWSNQADLGVPIVSDAMSSKRFLETKKNLHIADNEALEVGNKVAKVAPLYLSLNRNLV